MSRISDCGRPASRHTLTFRGILDTRLPPSESREYSRSNFLPRPVIELEAFNNRERAVLVVRYRNVIDYQE